MIVQQIPLSSIVVADRRRRDPGDLAGLAQSMKDRGQLQPIGLNSRRELVFGWRRMQAAAILGWSEIKAVIFDSFDNAIEAMLAERDENTCRKDLNPEEMIRSTEDLHALFAKEGKRHQQDAARITNAKLGRDASGDLPEPSGLPTKGETAEKVGKVLGISATTYRRMKAVVKAADADPQHRDLVEKMNEDRHVEPSYRELCKRQGNPIVKRTKTKEETPSKEAESEPRPIPPGLPPRVAFAASVAPEMEQMIADLQRISKAAVRLGRNGPTYLDYQTVIHALGRAVTCINKSIFHSVCPQCKGGDSSHCHPCSGKGYVSKKTLEELGVSV